MTNREDAMKKVFLINETVLFEPDLRRLAPREGYPSRAMTLHGPVSECLNLLLEHNGQVVTQRFLFASVWEKQGTVVSTNALYQTISQIRKVLKNAGIEEDIIRTLPKTGFKSVAQVQAGELEEFVSPQKTVSVFVSSDESSVSTSVAVISPESQPRASGFNSTFAYALAGILFIFSCAVLYSVIREGKTELDNYQAVGKLNGCDIYSSWHDKDKSLKMFVTLSKRFAIQCQSGGTAWMTFNVAQQNHSVMVCDRHPRESGAQCDSIIYRPHNHEE